MCHVILFSPIAPSGAPLDVSVIVNSSSTARISWSPPTYIDRNGIIVNYTVRIITTDTDRGTIREANVVDNYYDASGKSKKER